MTIEEFAKSCGVLKKKLPIKQHPPTVMLYKNIIQRLVSMLTENTDIDFDYITRCQRIAQQVVNYYPAYQYVCLKSGILKETTTWMTDHDLQRFLSNRKGDFDKVIPIYETHKWVRQ